MELGVAEIKELIREMSRSGIDSLSLETGNFKLSLDRKAAVPAATPLPQQACPPMPAAESRAEEGQIVCSPIVGTFYSAPAPDKPPFVSVGQRVKKGDTLFIVESMKLMNEIASEYDGVVAEVLVKNGQGVEYGQPIMRITV